MQICHEIEKPANMQIISLKMHEVKNHQTETDLVSNFLSDSTGDGLIYGILNFLTVKSLLDFSKRVILG